MADDIFEKMWTQLERIYNRLGDGLIARSDDSPRESVNSSIRQTFGLQDTRRLSDTDVIEMREEAQADKPVKRNEYWDYLDFTQRQRYGDQYGNVVPPPVIEPENTASEIRSAIQELGPVIAGAVSQVQPTAAGLNPDLVKGQKQTDEEADAEAQADSIGDKLDRVIELLSMQAASTKELVDEAHGFGVSSGMLQKATSTLAAAWQDLLVNGGQAGTVLGDKVKKAGRLEPLPQTEKLFR